MTARRAPRWKRLLAAFDARGATYAELAGRPGWFIVEWYEPGYPQPNGAPGGRSIIPGCRAAARYCVKSPGAQDVVPSGVIRLPKRCASFPGSN